MKRRSFIKGLIGGLIAAPVSAALVKDKKINVDKRFIPEHPSADYNPLDYASDVKVTHERLGEFTVVRNSKWTRLNETMNKYIHQLDRRPCPFRHLVKKD